MITKRNQVTRAALKGLTVGYGLGYGIFSSSTKSSMFAFLGYVQPEDISLEIASYSGGRYQHWLVKEYVQGCKPATAAGRVR